MTLLTPDLEIARIEDRVLSLGKVISDLRKHVEVLTQESETEGKLDSISITKALNELGKVVTLCTALETKLDDCRNRQAGIARGGYALDLDQARADIGGKLDRLRACGSSGTLLE